MEEKEFTGKTVEDAVAAGLKELGLTAEEVEVTVLDEGKKKLIGSVPARVLLTPKNKATDGERAIKFLIGLLPHLGVNAEPVLEEENEKIIINLTAESAREIIGRRGEMIDAIQVLTGAVANTGRRDYKRVVVDCSNYREEREETLKHVANKLAAKAVRTGRRVRLEPMNPYERRIIHAALAESEEVFTKSEGREPERFVVIIPKNAKNGGRGGRDKNRSGKDGRRREKYGDKFGEKKPYPKRELPAEDTPQTSGTTYKKGGYNGFFGTFLGNEGEEDTTTDTTPTENSEE
ncbi:MAG: protein jag [Clostridia bacterium]|nr:protein jag [Clostridia bacterium]